MPPKDKYPLAEAREQLLARAAEEGQREAAICREVGELLDEMGLQVYASQQMKTLLISEPIETENTGTLYTPLCAAYMAYRSGTNQRGRQTER